MVDGDLRKPPYLSLEWCVLNAEHVPILNKSEQINANANRPERAMSGAG